MSLLSKPYANQTMALKVRKKEREKGMNSTLLVLITSLCKKLLDHACPVLMYINYLYFCS